MNFISNFRYTCIKMYNKTQKPSWFLRFLFYTFSLKLLQRRPPAPVPGLSLPAPYIPENPE